MSTAPLVPRCSKHGSKLIYFGGARCCRPRCYNDCPLDPSSLHGILLQRVLLASDAYCKTSSDVGVSMELCQRCNKAPPAVVGAATQRSSVLSGAVMQPRCCNGASPSAPGATMQPRCCNGSSPVDPELRCNAWCCNGASPAAPGAAVQRLPAAAVMLSSDDELPCYDVDVSCKGLFTSKRYHCWKEEDDAFAETNERNEAVVQGNCVCLGTTQLTIPMAVVALIKR